MRLDGGHGPTVEPAFIQLLRVVDQQHQIARRQGVFFCGRGDKFLARPIEIGPREAKARGAEAFLGLRHLALIRGHRNPPLNRALDQGKQLRVLGLPDYADAIRDAGHLLLKTR